MVCWNIGVQFPRLVTTVSRFFQLNPAKWSWSSEAAMYYRVTLLGILMVTVVMAAAQIIYFHIFLRYQVGSSILENIRDLLDKEIGVLFINEASFIKHNFQRLTQTTQYYIDPLYTYFKVLVDRANTTEKRGDFRTTYQIWFFEVMLMLLLGNIVFSIIAEIR